MAKKRYDVHPNVTTITVTQDTIDSAKTLEVPMFEPVQIAQNKVLIAEILKVQFDHDGNHSAAALLYNMKLEDSVTDKVLALYRRQVVQWSPVGATINESHVIDLTDGQGNGMLVAKNPNVRYASAGTGIIHSGYFKIYWRYKEVTQSELVQMLGGI